MKSKIIISAFLLGISSISSFSQKISFSTFFTSSCEDVHSTAQYVTDKDGNVFIVGGTREGLQVTDDAFQKEYSGCISWNAGDLFLMKLSPTGEILYSTYLGGAGDEFYCNDIFLDDSGNVCFGFTTSSTNLPVSSNAYQKSFAGGFDHYIMKFSNDCKYIASTYLGGSRNEYWAKLVVHNNVFYLIGITNSTNFPVTENALQKEITTWYNSDPDWQDYVRDISITALSPDLDSIYFSTYLGGSNEDNFASASFDDQGNIIITGNTWSDDFPTTKNCYDSVLSGETDALVTIINSDLSSIIYSTLIGGNSNDQVLSAITNDTDILTLSGFTSSTNFPVTADALNSNFSGGANDGFIMRLNKNTSNLMYSTFIGGSGYDYLTSLLFKNNKYILSGFTESTDFPFTSDAFDKTYNGQSDMVIMILDETLKNIDYSTYIGGSQNDGQPYPKFVNDSILMIVSTSKSTDFPITNNQADFNNAGMLFLMEINMNGISENLHNPVSNNQLNDTTLYINKAFNFYLPENSFQDEDLLDRLDYSVILSDGNALPSWLKFNVKAKRLYGTPRGTDTLNIKIEVTDNHFNTASDEFQIFIQDTPTHIESQFGTIIKLYPNPTKGLVNVSFGNSLKKALVEIYNLQGTQVFSKTFHNIPSATIDLTGNPTGIYVVKVIAGGVSYEEKIVKE